MVFSVEVVDGAFVDGAVVDAAVVDGAVVDGDMAPTVETLWHAVEDTKAGKGVDIFKDNIVEETVTAAVETEAAGLVVEDEVVDSGWADVVVLDPTLVWVDTIPFVQAHNDPDFRLWNKSVWPA